MSEPCRHERFDADVRELGALGAAQLEVKQLRAELAGECAHTALSLVYRQERDDALAALTQLRAEIRLLTIGPAHQHHAGKVTPSQLCDVLERTALEATS